MEILDVLKTFGVEVAMLVAMGWYIVKSMREHREDVEKLREAHRLDAKEMREAHAGETAALREAHLRETERFAQSVDKMAGAVQELREVLK